MNGNAHLEYVLDKYVIKLIHGSHCKKNLSLYKKSISLYKNLIKISLLH